MVFLTCQETAAEQRMWPTDVEISHGRAGEIEVQAEGVADELGLRDIYRQTVRENIGPIAAALKLIDKTTGALRNGRAPCICGRTNKRGRRKLRRECFADNDLCLPLMEAERRREEQKFWSLHKGLYHCCSTMDECPLKEDVGEYADH